MTKILVIDDEEPIRLNIRLILQKEGYETILAKNGTTGIALAKKEMPELIICDVLMPKFSGFEVLTALRKFGPTSLIPFIFLTGILESEDQRKAMIMGGDDYLTKPFKISDLVETVRSQLKKRDNLKKQIDEEKWEVEERFKAIFKYAPVGISIMDSEDRIVRVNNNFIQMIGYSEIELYSMSVFDLIYPEDTITTAIGNDKLRSKEIEHCSMEKRYISKDKGIIWVNVSSSGVYNKNNELAFFISMVQDITEKKNSEIESLKAERLQTIGKMAAMLTHEIKTPLTSIRMNADLLKASPVLTENNKKSLAIIKKEAIKLNNLVKDVLQFANQMDLNKKVFDLNVFFNEIAQMFDGIIKPRNIKFINNSIGTDFLGDTEKLSMAFSALINNSIEAIGENGEIEVASCEDIEQGKIIINLKDSGCGIKEKEKIFVPFYTSKTSGTGLGLIIAQKIFQQHSGNINLLSSVPGETIFEIIFSLKG